MMITIHDLKTKLKEIDNITNEEWLSGLDARKMAELEFHDLHRDMSRVEAMNSDSYEKFYGNKKYYSGTTLSRIYVKDWIQQHAKGKIFLDYACGNGYHAILAAKAGAELAIGIDISLISVNNAKAEAEKERVKRNTHFLQADAEDTKLFDNCVDTIICNGVLHHLNLSHAFLELHRILKRGGKILAVLIIGVKWRYNFIAGL